MSDITNFGEAHAALRQFYGNSGTRRYDLGRMLSLMDFLGNPQDKLRVIHVAGTSGKTSTAYYIAALLQNTGSKVGLTVSPHVDEVNERLQIDGKPVPEQEFCKQLMAFLQLVGQSKLRPSYFEFMVAFAYWEFAKQGVDYAVVEVGLGGLLDGSNVVSRRDKVCVITDIGFDHTEVLGDTLAEIAAQKAGIVQPHNHVFMYGQGGEIMGTVKRVCHEQQAPLHVLPASVAIASERLPLFQQRNLGLAVQVANFVVQRDRRPALTDADVENAAKTRIPARMERFEVGGKTLIMDGSHNAQKLGVLVESIQAAYPHQKIAALVAFVEGPDERWQGGMAALLPILNKLTITSFEAEQDVPRSSIAPNRLQHFCESKHYMRSAIVDNPEQAFRELLKSPEPLLLVAGSFYLLNHIRPLLVENGG